MQGCHRLDPHPYPGAGISADGDCHITPNLEAVPKEHLIAFVAIAFFSILSRRLKRHVVEDVSTRRLQTDTHARLRCLGSRTRLSRSPTRFTAITVRNSASPGNIIVHGA
jgi:hypothetical protein